MYAASGILILCRWPSCALAKGRLQSQDVVLVLCHSKVECFVYNALLQPRYDDDSEFCSLSYLVFDAVLTLIKVPVPSKLYCMHLFLDNLFCSHIILSVKIVVFWVMDCA